MELHNVAFLTVFGSAGASRPLRWRPPRASAKRRSSGPRATGRPPSSRRQGKAQAIETAYNAIRAANPDQSLIAILQLETLSKFADSENAKIVVPYETAGLLGAAQALRSMLDGTV